jgi:hypothetical protein
MLVYEPVLTWGIKGECIGQHPSVFLPTTGMAAFLNLLYECTVGRIMDIYKVKNGRRNGSYMPIAPIKGNRCL